MSKTRLIATTMFVLALGGGAIALVFYIGSAKVAPGERLSSHFDAAAMKFFDDAGPSGWAARFRSVVPTGELIAIERSAETPGRVKPFAVILKVQPAAFRIIELPKEAEGQSLTQQVETMRKIVDTALRTSEYGDAAIIINARLKNSNAATYATSKRTDAWEGLVMEHYSRGDKNKPLDLDDVFLSRYERVNGLLQPRDKIALRDTWLFRRTPDTTLSWQYTNGGSVDCVDE